MLLRRNGRNISEKFVKGWKDAPEGLREKVAEICKKYLKKNSSVLDLGCGYGILCNYLRESGFKCIGVEIEKDRHEELKKHGIKSICANLNNGIPVKSNSLNCAVAVEVIEHLENPWNFMREIHRILKENGLAVITFPNFTDFLSRLKFFFWTEFSFFIKKIPKGGHITILPYWLFEYLAKNTGFEIIEIESNRTWIERLKKKSIKHKTSLFVLLPLLLLVWTFFKIFKGETKSLLPETHIFVLRKNNNIRRKG